MNNWKKITKNTIRQMGLAGDNFIKGEQIFVDLIKKYEFVDFAGVDSGCPILYVLKNGNMRGLYNNPRNGSMFYKMYGFSRTSDMTYPLLDHAYYFRTKDKKVYLVSNTYLDVNEIEAEFNKICKEKDSGDYSGIRYIIEQDSYYSEKTRMVLFYND